MCLVYYICYCLYTIYCTQFSLAPSPGLFFSLNNNERNGRTDGRMREKNRPGIYCRGSNAQLPTITQILGNRVYICKLLGFFSLFSVYSCILIRVSAFSVAALWLLNCCMAFRTLTEGSLLKLRQEEALMHLYNSACCMLAGSTVYIRLQC